MSKMVKVSKVREDPSFPNVRGRIRDTTGLQNSIQEHGRIERPIWVRPDPDDEGAYLLISGARRLAAARALNILEVPAEVKKVNDDEILDLMLVADLHEELPLIVADQDGQVTGGLCWVAYTLHQRGNSRLEIAPRLGVTPDIAGAFIALYDEPLFVKKRIANNDLAISVYSLLKHQPLDVKEAILKKAGRISAQYVRTCLKRERKQEMVAQLREQRAAASLTLSVNGQTTDAEPEDDTDTDTDLLDAAGLQYVSQFAAAQVATAAPALNQTISTLQGLQSASLSGTDFYLVDQIITLATNLKEQENES